MIERKLNSRITLLREKVKVIVANTRKMRRTTNKEEYKVNRSYNY